MKIIKLILKGLLLYVTAFVAILFITGIDSIVEQGYTLVWLFILIAFISICIITISKDEFEILTLEKWFKSLDKRKEDKIKQ